MKTTTASTYVIVATALVILCFTIEVSAKRGCSAFGHSCFGGHGKRSESNGVDDSLQEDSVGINRDSQDYDVPRAGGEILLADPGQIYQERPMPRFQALPLSPEQRSRYNLSPFIRQWLASYRRANSADVETK